MPSNRPVHLPPLARARYDSITRVLHWLTLWLLIAQFGLGWFMPEVDGVKEASGLIAWHVGVGTTLLVVIAARLLWAIVRRAPAPVEQSSALRAVAKAVHMAMYALLLFVPFLGWLNASARNWMVKLGGVLPLPQIATPGSLSASIGEFHSASSTILLMLIGLHVLAVVIHQVAIKDQLLRRML
ncbi:cytochrome b [Caballeronia arationis]|nr:cytochrome b/b6 domain-containing protein [Caballeronia arationis]